MTKLADPEASTISEATIIICAYSMARWPDLRHTMACVARQTHPARQTILVIDHNPDLLSLARAALTDAQVVANVYARGASGSRNTGYELSATDTLVFLDDDTVPDEGWLAALLAPLGREDVLGTGGDLQPLWRESPPDWLTPEFHWTIGCSYTGLPTTHAPYRNPISANMAVRKSVFEAAGGFEQALSRRDVDGVVTGTAEETEFCIRAERASPGRVWMFVPDAHVLHVVPAQRTQFAFYRQRCRLEGASKAILTELTGSQDGLSSELAYVTSVLPRALARELRAAVAGDSRGARRAGAILVGVWCTAAAYARVRMQMRFGRRPRPAPSVVYALQPHPTPESSL